MSKPSYYADVVGELLLYREYKQRILMIREMRENQLKAIRENDISFLSAIDYDKANVQTSNISDTTADSALKHMSERLENELRYKRDLVKKIEIAYQGLDPIEQFIIRKKYMTGRVTEDKDIYTHPDYRYGRSKYYEIKDEAVKKYAEIRGFI